MEERPKEEVGEHRMLLPEISTAGTALHNYPPIPFELLTSHERLPPATTTEAVPPVAQGEAARDVGTLLAPGALAALRAALAGKSHYEATANLPTTKPDIPSLERRNEGRVPVLKTSTGSFLVTPTPPVSLSFPPRPPYPPRPLPNAPPPVGLATEHMLFTTPERRINVQNLPRSSLTAPPKSPVSTYLVQAPSGQYCIMSRGEAPRKVEGRMMPMDMSHHPSALPQPNASVETKPVAPPNVPTHPTLFLKPMKTTVSLAPKLQTPAGSRVPQSQPQLSQKLLERPMQSAPESHPVSESFAAQAENLKNLFLSGGSHLPVTPIDDLSFAAAPSPSEFFSERSTVSHKRRKTSTPASLEDIPYPISPAQQAGVELLLQAATRMGDPIPVDTDLHNRRGLRGSRRGIDEQSFASRLAYCLDPALRRGLSVLDSFAGVYPILDGSFVARVRFRGCYVLIGSFRTAEDAARAYDRVVLSIRGRKARTNYPYSEYLNFELQNAKRAFEAKYKQCERIARRGSAWPWARAAQTLLATVEEDSEEGVPELVQSVGPLTEAVPGASVFELLQNVMLKKRDLNGTFDLIQARIRQLQTRIQSGLSTEEECNCVGQYAYVANILGRLVSMQNDWERRQDAQGTRGALLDDSSSLMLSDQAVSEPKQVTSFQEDMLPNKQSVSEGDQPRHPELMQHSFLSTEPGFLGDEQQSSCAVLSQNQDLHGSYTESIRWVRLLASSLWPRKRGGGMLWKAYQPLFKSSHHRRSILKLREELYLNPDQLKDDFP